MASGVLYDGGMLTSILVEDTSHKVSRNFLNAVRCLAKKAFIGSIHDSLEPNVPILARP
jgi:hypothetical protein